MTETAPERTRATAPPDKWKDTTHMTTIQERLRQRALALEALGKPTKKNRYDIDLNHEAADHIDALEKALRDMVEMADVQDAEDVALRDAARRLYSD